jgi:hypothetical protein
MSGAMPLLPQYAFMAWKGTLYLLFYDWLEIYLRATKILPYKTGSYEVQQSGEIEAVCAATSNVPTVPAL